MSVIFLSHSSHDDELAAVVKRWLEQNEHRSVFLDFDPETGIPAGRNWERELYQQLRHCRAVVVLCTDASAASRWCFAEITQARSLGKAIIPLKKQGCAVDPILEDLQIIDLGKGDGEALGRLGRALEIAGIDAAGHFEWDASRSPYPGFLAFQEQDAAVFFGREDEIGAGLDALNQARWRASAGFLMLLGASGSGKSSLLRAGLLPRLRRNREQWLIVGPFKPGGDPLRELAGSLAQAFHDLDATHDWRRLRDRLAAWRPGRANPLAELADDLRLGAGSREAGVLLVVDQFEELLGHRPDHPSHHLLALIRAAADQAGGELLVLGTMRSDYLGEFQKHPVLRGLEFTSFTLGPMLDDGLIRIIEEPARQAGIELDPGLATAILRDAEGGSALPLVAFSLRELYLRFAGEGKLTVEQYGDRLGGLHGAVARVAESVLPGKNELRAIEPDLRAAFLSMARFDDHDRLARAPVAWSDVPTSVHSYLERFVEARLLTSQGDGEAATLEVAHEALFTAWGTLARWLDESREALAVRREIAHAARLWAGEGRTEDYLWRGGRLRRATELRHQGQLRLGEDEREYLAAAEAASRQRGEQKNRRRRARMAAISLTAIFMTALTLVAYAGKKQASRERVQAEIQGAKALAIQARSAGYQIDQALLLAIEAARTLEDLGKPADLYEARTSLLALLLANPGLEATLREHRERIETLAISPDGSLLASGSADGRLLIWELATRRPVRSLDHCELVARLPEEEAKSCGERIKAVAYSRDGTRLAVGTERGRVVVWSTFSFEPEATPQEQGGVVCTLAFSPFGRVLAMGDLDGHIRVWDLSRPDRPHTPLDGHSGVVTRVVFDASGERLVSGGRDKTIREWDLSTREGSILYDGDSAVYSLDIGGDGAMAAGFVDGWLRSWGPDGELRFEREVHQAQIRDLLFDPSGETLVSAGLDGIVRLTDARTGSPATAPSQFQDKALCIGECAQVTELGGHVQGATNVALSADGARLATGAGDGGIRLWDLGRLTRSAYRSPHRTWLTSAAILSSDLAATGAQDGSIELTTLLPGVTPPTIEQQEDEVWGLTFSPDRRFLASATGKRAVRVWALDSLAPGAGRPKATLQFEHFDHRAWIWSAAFSPDNRFLATSDEAGIVQLLEVPEHRLLAPLEDEDSAQSLAFGRHREPAELAVGGKDGRIRIWDLEDRESGPLVLFGHEGPVVDLEFSHRGDRLASASLDGSVRIWRRGDAGWQDQPEPILRQGVGMRSVAFNDDDRSLAAGDLHGEIRIWDAGTGTRRFGLSGHQGAILGLEFADGWLLSGSEDRILRRWEIGLVESLETAYDRACELANRDLERNEWREFLGDREYRENCSDRAAAGADQRTAS